MVGGFDFDGWLGTASGWVMKQAVGQRTADALVKQDEHGADPGALFCKAVGVVFVDALQKPVAFHLAQVITELIGGVVLGRKGKGGLQGLPDLEGTPTSLANCGPPWSSTSMSRIMRVSWILMPGILLLPEETGRASR